VARAHRPLAVDQRDGSTLRKTLGIVHFYSDQRPAEGRPCFPLAVEAAAILRSPDPGGDAMLLVREIMYCRPGKVRPLVEKFVAMAKLGEQTGWGKMRVMTDVSAERYWTLVSEMEVESIDAFMAMMQDPEEAKAAEEIMQGYHDLVESGRREIYHIEG
jgi:hypothetical protein